MTYTDKEEEPIMIWTKTQDSIPLGSVAEDPTVIETRERRDQAVAVVTQLEERQRRLRPLVHPSSDVSSSSHVGAQPTEEEILRARIEFREIEAALDRARLGQIAAATDYADALRSARAARLPACRARVRERLVVLYDALDSVTPHAEALAREIAEANRTLGTDTFSYDLGWGSELIGPESLLALRRSLLQRAG